jgi:Glycosyltransferase family 87
VRDAPWPPGRTWIVIALAAAALVASLALYMHGPRVHVDQSLYARYAWDFWTGPARFRSLPVEYPPLSLLPFTLAIVPPLPDFVSVFALWMLALLVATLLVIARLESARAAEVAAVYLAVGAWGTVLGRYDLVPAVAVLGAFWAARARRFPLAYALLAVGVLLKLYPVVLVPVVALEQWRALAGRPPRWPPPLAVAAGVGLCCGLVAVGFAVAFALDPAGWLAPFTYNARRPLQIESVPATLLWAGGPLGFPVSPNKSFGSDNLVGPLAGALGLAAMAALVAGLLWTYWRQAAGRLELVQAFAACVLVVLCTGRVLSPQYLVWALPLIAMARPGYDPLWLLICALTTLVFPFAYLQVHPVGSGPPASYPFFLLGLIAIRNAALVAACARALLPGQHSSIAMLGPGRWRPSKPQIGR